MFENEMLPSSLAKHLLNYDYVMIDTCSLMEDSFSIWMSALEGAIKRNYINRPIPVYVLDSSLNELKKHKKDRIKNDKRIAAIRALRIIRKCKWHKIVTILKIGKNQNFADKQILAKAQEDRTDYKILVITQDKKLASDLNSINKQLSVKGRFIAIEKILPSGELGINKGEEPLPPTASKGQTNQKPFFNKGSNEQKGPLPHQTHRPDPSELNNKVIAADKRLRSLVSNENYPTDKKIADAKALLSDLSRLSAEKVAALHLFYTVEKLKALIDSLSSPKPIEKKEVKIVVKESAPKQLKPVKKKDLWYEYGKTVEEAFRNVATHYGVFFRDPKVSYVPAIHGPADLVEEDLNRIVALFGELKEGEKPIRSYKSINLMAERTPKGIKAWIDLNGALSPQPQKEEVAKPKKAKPTKSEEPKKEEPQKKQEKKPAKTKEPPKKPVEKAKAEKNVKEDKPKSSEPSEPTKKEKAEKPAKKAEKPAEPEQNKKKGGSKKTEADKPEKPSAKASVKKEETPKKEAPKEVKKKPEPKKQEPSKPSKEQPKKEPEAKKANKKSTILEEAIAFDANLKSNVLNPQYSKEQKVKDIEAQIERVKKIPVADRNKLNYNLDSLKGMLSMVK